MRAATLTVDIVTSSGTEMIPTKHISWVLTETDLHSFWGHNSQDKETWTNSNNTFKLILNPEAG